MYGTPEYSAWQSMIARCNNPNAKNYKDYGGRGIRVCQRWLGEHGFQNFLNDMGRRPSNGLSLDREKNDLGYSPDNCRWANSKQQGRNKRNSRVLTVGAQSAPLSEWAERTGIGKTTIRERLRRGWSVKRALFTAVH